MLIVGFDKIGKTKLASKYKDKVKEINYTEYKENKDWPINYIEAIKKSILQYDITIIPYLEEVILCLDALNIDYTLVFPDISCENDYIEYWNKYNKFAESEKSKIILDKNETIEMALANLFDWIILEKPKENIEEEKLPDIPLNKNKLTMEQLLDDNLEITEADVRDLKATQNKLKVGMLLQAKNSLNRVLKLSNTLDKLYDALLDRIDNGLETTDTASLMYTTEYISKALNDTNQFIVSLISNEKIQNFFIIDNSTVINASDDRADINSRERIRKAVEIVMDNLDYFEQGQFNNLKNPNIIEVQKEDNDADQKS